MFTKHRTGVFKSCLRIEIDPSLIFSSALTSNWVRRMKQNSVKTLTVPETLYEDMKKVLDQASVKEDIRTLLDHSVPDVSEKKALLKHVLSDIAKYDDVRIPQLQGLILTLLLLKYRFTKRESFAILEDILSTL